MTITKRLRGIPVALCLLGPLATTAAEAGPFILFDLGSGRVLEHEAAFQRWYPASLTKLMTGYVTFRAVAAGELQLDSPIRVTSTSAAEPPAKMGYKPGSVMSLDNALKMMFIKSANDIARAVGENVGGSEAAFVERMNAEAVRLGMTGTHFGNTNGLHSVENYSTARDLAVLTSAIRKEFPQYAPLFGIEGLKAGKATMKTYNLLIGRLDGADGMKTGFICASGFNMIGSATRSGRTLVAVVLGEDSAVARTEKAARLLEAGFMSPNQPDATLATMPPDADAAAPPPDMRQEICERKPAAAASEDGAAHEPVKSPWQEKLPRPLNLVTVGLGGANGPVPLARRGADGKEMATVPIPTWRPDLPPPVFNTAAAAAGKSAAAGATRAN